MLCAILKEVKLCPYIFYFIFILGKILLYQSKFSSFLEFSLSLLKMLSCFKVTIHFGFGVPIRCIKSVQLSYESIKTRFAQTCILYYFTTGRHQQSGKLARRLRFSKDLQKYREYLSITNFNNFQKSKEFFLQKIYFSAKLFCFLKQWSVLSFIPCQLLLLFCNLLKKIFDTLTELYQVICKSV